MADRRAQIAEAGIRILATRGARALTHLNIDRELELAPGSTSYYARSRRDLISLIIDRLANRVTDDLAAQTIPQDLTPQAAASIVVAGLETTMRRAEDHRARLLLLLECRSDPELHAALSTRPTVRATFIDTATVMLRLLGVSQPSTNAHDFAGLVDGLLMQRVIRAAPVNEEAIVAAYLRGLMAKSAHRSPNNPNQAEGSSATPSRS